MRPMVGRDGGSGEDNDIMKTWFKLANKHQPFILMVMFPTRGDDVRPPALHTTVAPSMDSVTVAMAVEDSVGPELSLIMVMVNGLQSGGGDPS